MVIYEGYGEGERGSCSSMDRKYPVYKMDEL